jgi:hypothetical protein
MEASLGEDLKIRIDRATLEKTRLEQREIALRVEDSLNWKQKWAQAAISLFVPIATAAMALTAAYVELRSVRDQREQLSAEKQAFERVKAADYVLTKANHAIDVLGAARNTAPERTAVLDALRDLMLSSTKLPEPSVVTIFSFLVDPDPRIEESARLILDNSASPNYAKSLASALLTAVPPISYKLARLLTRVQVDRQNISYIAPLVLAKDSVIAGHAMRALAQNSNVSLDVLMHLDDSASRYERMAYLVTSVITRDEGAKKSSLKYMADKLLGDKSFGTASYEFYSACAVNGQGDIYNKGVFERADISAANKILLATTGPKSMRAPATEMAQAIFQDVKETAKLARAGIDIRLVSSALGVPKPEFAIADLGQFSQEDILAVESYVNFDSVPHEALLKLRADLRAGKRFVITGAIDRAVAKQDGDDLSAVERDGIDIYVSMLQAANSHEQKAIDKAYDDFRNALGKKTGRPRSLSNNEMPIAAALVKAGKPKSLFDEVYVDAPFEYLVHFEQVAQVDRAYAVQFLAGMLQSKELTPLQGMMIAIKGGLESEFSSFAQEAFDEQLAKIGSIEQSQLREHPDYHEGDIDGALLALSLLTESADFKRNVGELKRAIETLGLVPARGLGVQVDLLNGSFGVAPGDAYAKVAAVLLPDVMGAMKGSGCDGYIYKKLIESDQLKEIVWAAVLD